MRLAGPALTLSGRVRYDDGEPVPGARVWVSDPSWFGNTSELGMDATCEGLSTTTLTRDDIARLWTEDDDDTATQRFRSPSLPMWSFVRADEHGRFELGGLAARDYSVRAMDEHTLQLVTQGPFPAGGAELELVLPRADRQIDNAVFAGLSLGPLAITAFTANSSGIATTTAHRIIYETDTGFLWFDANGTATGGRVQFADLAGGLVFSSSEFTVV